MSSVKEMDDSLWKGPTSIEVMDDSIWRGGDTVPDVSDEELKRFVMGVCNNEIFTDRHVRNQNDMFMVFMPLALGAFSHPNMPDSYRQDIGCIYEYMKEAGPRSINGMPNFFSFMTLNKAQAERAFAAIDKELERREQVEIK